MTILYTTVVDRSIKICIFLSKFILLIIVKNRLKPLIILNFQRLIKIGSRSLGFLRFCLSKNRPIKTDCQRRLHSPHHNMETTQNKKTGQSLSYFKKFCPASQGALAIHPKSLVCVWYKLHSSYLF